MASANDPNCSEPNWPALVRMRPDELPHHGVARDRYNPDVVRSSMHIVELLDIQAPNT